MCIRHETREKARQSLAFSRVSKPHTHITHMLRQCTSIVYLQEEEMDEEEYTEMHRDDKMNRDIDWVSLTNKKKY